MGDAIDHPDLETAHWTWIRTQCPMCFCVVDRLVSMNRAGPNEQRCFICCASHSWAWWLLRGNEYGHQLVGDWEFRPAEQSFPMPLAPGEKE